MATKTDASTTLGEFLDFLFEGQDGYVYAPTKHLATGFWQPYHFLWPDSREEIISHLLMRSKDTDVYVSPSLFKEGSGKKEFWKGSQFAWCEFDGNSAEGNIANLPPPSLRIQSSTAGHEHWYWRLDNFEADRNVIEGLCRKIAYALGADRSGWDANQVLRPPGTLHHASNRRTVVKQARKVSYKLSEFRGLPDIPRDEAFETLTKDLPAVSDVVSKYKWPADAYDLFFRPEQKVGSRSSALMKLGFYCVEMDMTNEEAFTILRDADDRWKKYTSHSNRAERLLSIISRAKAEKSKQSELLLAGPSELLYSFREFLDTKIKMEWVYGDMLAKQGLGVISSLPYVGKSVLSIRLQMHAVLQKPFLIWTPGEHRIKKAAFLSLEMDRMEFNKTLEDMRPSFSNDEWEEAIDKCMVYPVGYAVGMDKPQNQDQVKAWVDTHEIDFLLIDSLKAISSNLKEDKMDPIFNFINKDLRSERGVTVWILHHNRKPPSGEGKARDPKDTTDLYGDVFIGAHATTVLALTKKSPAVRAVHNLKVRLAEEGDSFRIQRGPGLNWHVMTDQEAPEEETMVGGDEDNGSGSSKPRIEL